MSYIIRNTVILGVVMVIILGAGLYVTMVSQPKKLKAIDSQIKVIEIDLQNTPDLANQFNTLSAQLEDIKKRWETRNKDIPQQDVSGETYGYLTRTIDLSGEVKMDLNYVGPQSYGNFGFNVYNLKGEAPFTNIFRFLWYVENGRRLYKVGNLVLRGYESKDKETQETKILVLYELDLLAFYSSIPELNVAPAYQSLVPVNLRGNPFYPLILREIPPPQAGEIEIERSILTAVIPGKAFIIDQTQKTRVLEEGDPVYLGYVTKIHPEEGKIECLLNKGGVSERYELHIRVGQPIK